ncbi:MAG: transporter [Leptospiraceae bacterium]|nr:transporter [Leptospiraceae bacterium]MCK6380751.1 transporter [Leptospiraceae bacterium]NUM42317.1 transporter [Leptospiraceae bacterium]
MKTVVKLIFGILIFQTLLYSEKKTPLQKVTMSDSVYNNFKLAKGKIIEVEGEVIHVLYSGQSVRFVMAKNLKNPVVIESYDPELINGAKVGYGFRLCGVFLKHRKFTIQEKKMRLPVILVESKKCSEGQ